jgi:hypothetical protein
MTPCSLLIGEMNRVSDFRMSGLKERHYIEKPVEGEVDGVEDETPRPRSCDPKFPVRWGWNSDVKQVFYGFQ